MRRQLLHFDISPRPAEEGKAITVSFDYPSDSKSITVEIVNKDERVKELLTISIKANKGKATFMIPKGWGPSLYINHKDFIAGSVGVDK